MIIRIDQTKVSEQIKAARVVELKKLLLETDYKVLPDYDKPVPEDLLQKRQAWRTEIRELEA